MVLFKKTLKTLFSPAKPLAYRLGTEVMMSKHVCSPTSPPNPHYVSKQEGKGKQ